jgi:hypothetical protein
VAALRKRAREATPLPPPEKCIFITMDPGHANVIAAGIQRSVYPRDALGNTPRGTQDSTRVYWQRTRREYYAATGARQRAKRAEQRLQSQVAADPALGSALTALQDAGGIKTTDHAQLTAHLQAQRTHWDALRKEYIVSSWSRGHDPTTGAQVWGTGWYAHETMRAFSRKRSMLDRWASELLR